MGTSNTESGSTGRRLPDDVVADLLESDRRRIALRALARRETAVTVDDLAALVRARERDTPPDAVDRDERRRVREEFFQRHLPKLVATDVVSYDSLLGTVELADRDTVDEALEEA